MKKLILLTVAILYLSGTGYAQQFFKQNNEELTTPPPRKMIKNISTQNLERTVLNVSSPVAPAPKGMVNVTLEAGNVWGDGTGYQLLLDATATLHGTVFAGNWLQGCDNPGYYDVFSHTIPENADPVCTTTNMVLNSSITIQIPAGTYDLYVINPSPGANALYVAQGAYGQQNDFVFQDGKKYKFHVLTPENATLVVEDDIPAGAPAAVANLTLTPGVEGALNAVISWTNPSLTIGGEPLAELTAISIYQNEATEPLHTVSNPTIGEAENYMANVTASGNYTYRVVAENTEGTTPATTSAWIGLDLPAAPQEVTLVKDDVTASLSWTAPAAGLHNAYFVVEDVLYDVYRMPDETLVANGQAGLTFSETIANPVAVYYRVVARNSAGEGGAATSNIESFCTPAVTTFPWTEGFEGEAFPPCVWQVHDVDQLPYPGGSASWGIANAVYYVHSGAVAAGFGQANGYPQEGWLVTPPITIPETGFYALRFWTMSNLPENMVYNGVWISTTDNNPESFTELYALTADDVTWDYKQIEQLLTAYSGQTVYIGFKYTGQGGNSWFIDDISIAEVAVTDASVGKLYGANTPIAGKPFIYKTTVSNGGGEALAGFAVKLKDADDNVLVTYNAEMAIAPDESTQINLIWTPATAGNFSIRAVVEMPDDDNADNDETSALTVNVQAAGNTYEGNIGTGTASTTNYYMPFNFVYNSSNVQTLYFDHDLIASQGAITELRYFNNFTDELSDKAVKIWMANTDLNRLDTWLPASEFTLVYDGAIDFPVGENTVAITLDVPYIYTGQNLVIMTEKPTDTQAYNSSNVFRFTDDNDFAGRSLYYQSYDEPFDFTQTGIASNRYPNTVIKMELEGGSVSGVITDGGNPVEGAVVEIVDSYNKTVTDKEGSYSFDFLPTGNYQFKASKHGYTDNTSSIIAVTADNNSEVNIAITPVPLYTVTGKVTGSNAPDGLDEAQITLSGYHTYTATADAQGVFSIPNVYGGFIYNVNVTLAGYLTHVGTFNVNADGAPLNVTLNEIPYTVINPVAYQEGSDAVIEWQTPTGAESYIMDDGTAENGFTMNPNIDASFGNKFPVNQSGVLTSIDVFGQNIGTVSTGRTVTVDIYDESQTLVASSAPFVLPSNEWINVPVGNVPYSGTFYAMVHWHSTAGQTYFLGFDETGAYAEDSLDMVINPDGTWYVLHLRAGANPGICMIRANAIREGKGAVSYGYGASEKTVTPAPANFHVYRLSEGQPEEEWTQVAEVTEASTVDNLWTTLTNGNYQYAVKAGYASGALSAAKLTNVLTKEMYSISLSANLEDGGNITGGGTFNAGESITVVATANANYTFINWTEDGVAVSTNASYTFTVTGNRTLVANFLLRQFKVTFNTPEHGTLAVTANGAALASGDMVDINTELTIAAMPNNNYELDVLTVNGENFASGETHTVIGNVEIECTFKQTNVGIDENTLTGITVYPNPFTDEIRVNNPSVVKNITVTNVSGQTVHIKTHGTASLQTGNLTAGVYFVIIETIAGEKAVFKMVKK
ncbi:MAG: DUF2436 domain-containing protein [Cytophagaceae bacterium]|jgi:hypothetical protein|nr:DUF2436 domain-containing protein [Cytophagaceae bacterium]